MRLHSQAIYKLHGVTALPPGPPEIPLVALSSPTLSALLTTTPEAHLAHFDRSRAVATLLLKGLFAPDEGGAFDERLAAEIAVMKEARAKATASGVFLVLHGEADIPAPAFKARRDAEIFGVSLDDVPKDSIRERFRGPTQAVLAAIPLGMPAGNDIEFEKISGTAWLEDEDSGKPIYVLNIEMGTPRLSIARPFTPEALGAIADLATTLNGESGSQRAYSLLRTSLDRATDELQGFIAAWSALEIFINSTFKSTYEARWFVIMGQGAPPSSQPIFDRLADVMKDKYRLADKFLIMAAVLSPDDAAADEAEFRRLKKVRDELFHLLDGPPGPLPREAVQRLLLKFMRLHLGRQAAL